MASHQPRVSIGMPIYNEERFLREALDSLLAQDYADFELIICDNASQDSTPEICREYAARDPRVQYHRNPVNVGGTENFNVAFRLAGGEYFMWAGGHDVWAPTYISRCVEVLESDAAVVACNSITRHMSQEGKDLGRAVRQLDTRGRGLLVRANLALWQVSPFFGYALMRAGVLRRNGLKCRPVIGPDHLFGFELALLGPMAIFPEPLFFLRDNRGESTRVINRTQANAEFRERLYPQGTRSVGRFVLLKHLAEEMRAVRRARLSFLQRIALWACIPPTCFLQLYRHVPEGLRRPVRSVVARCSRLPVGAEPRLPAGGNELTEKGRKVPDPGGK